METNTTKELFLKILVFRTNISTDKEVEQIKSMLDLEVNIMRWSIDREDIDKVLRIECEQLHPLTVIQILREAGFECEELPD